MSSSDEQLSNALVKIISKVDYDNKSQERPIGCAIRLDAHYVITCSHVLQSSIGKQVNLEEGMLFPSFLPHLEAGNNKPLLELVQFHSEKKGLVAADSFDDMALLKIQGEMEDNNIRIASPAKHDEVDEAFIVKSSTGSDMAEANYVGVSDEGWLQLKFPNKEQVVEKGDSGSPVWNVKRTAITGMIVARKQDKGLCYAIPMYKIIRAFSEHFKKEQISPPDFLKEDDKYLQEIKQDIERDLKNSSLFCKQINLRCKVSSSTPGAILQFLINQCHAGNFGELIRSLRSAYVDGIDELDKENIRGRRDLQRAARGVVSKLVVFTVKQKEILRLKEIHAKNAVASPLSKLSAPAAAGVVARTICSPMSLTRKGSGRLEGDSHVSLESGFKTEGSNTAVDMLLIEIAAKVIPSLKVDRSKKDSWKTDLVRQLNATIKLSKEDPDIRFKRMFFFILPLGEDVISKQHQNVIKQLKEYLNDVTFFYITSKYADNVLTVDDAVIEAALRSFFIILDEDNEQ